MIIMKFGGTSVEDALAMRRVLAIVRREQSRSTVVVLSAVAGATNALLKAARLSAEGKAAEAAELLEQLRVRHHAIARGLFGGQTPTEITGQIDRMTGNLQTLSKGLVILGESTPRSLDAFAAAGEVLSSTILAAFLSFSGIAARLVDARSFMWTTQEHTQAQPLFDVIDQRIPAEILPVLEDGTVVVTQGFIGCTPDGVTTTLGRGGSDYSAALIGAALQADEIQIWTDVDGILTADPSVVQEARHIAAMSFDEASELAYFGARVLHPSTVLPAVQRGIPIRVLNSRRPELPGTTICRESPPLEESLIRSIAYKEGITVVTVRSTRMLMASGFLAELFDVFKRHEVSVDVIATSEVTVSLTVDDPSALEGIVRDLADFASVNIAHQRAIVSVVGDRLKYSRGIAARVFTALAEAGINVELISMGGSDITLTFLIKEESISPAVTALHRAFFPSAHGVAAARN